MCRRRKVHKECGGVALAQYWSSQLVFVDELANWVVLKRLDLVVRPERLTQRR